MEALLYSDDSIMKIALENGFASVSAYNKAFRETYHQTPSEFRKARKSGQEQEQAEKRRMQTSVQRRVEEYLAQIPGDGGDESGQIRLAVDVDMDGPPETEWNRAPLRMVNVGAAADLLNASVQQALLDSRGDLDFEYVRFWNLYDPALYLDIHAPENRQNFSRLDAVTDFLVQNQWKPYLELGFKPRRILRTTTKVVHSQIYEDRFADEAEMERFYTALFWHFIRRYGSWTVQSWYFEYWEAPVRDDRSGTLQY